jgi:hypothetical protein
MSKTNLSKIKAQTPISIIVHGGNYLSFLLAKTLIEQGSHVVIIDKYTNNSKQFFSQLKKSGKATFIDFKGLKNFYEKIEKIDYLYYMLGEKIQNTPRIDSKDFLAETDYLNSSLSATNKYQGKISLITSLRLNRELANRVNNANTGKTKPYSPLELQRFGENYVAEFVDKTKANLRIIRLGTILGKGVDSIQDDTLDNLFSDATQKHQIEINGEGLEVHNLIHESDAIYGILKLTFDSNTKGEVISLCNKNDYTTLSLAYKLLELDVEAKAIKFVETIDRNTILQDLYIPAPNATQFSWKQNISLEEATIDQVKAYYENSDKRWELNKAESYRKTKEKIFPVTKTKKLSFLLPFLKPFQRLKKPKEIIKNFSYFKILRNSLLIILTLFLTYYLIAPVIGISLGGLLVYNKSQSLKESFAELNFNEIESSSSNIYKNISKVENNLNRLSWVFKLTNTPDYFSNINQVVQGTKYVASSAQDLVISLKPLGEYLKDFEPNIDTEQKIVNDYTDYLLSIDNNKILLKEGIYKMGLAQNLINTTDTTRFPKFAHHFVLDYKDLITETNNFVKPLEEVTTFLPDILGAYERKRYLIILQDNNEIRGTGGWISAYAIIAIEGGQIREFFIDDIYNTQTTLNLNGSSYNPPISLKKALPNTPYSFPLVNWNANLDSVLLSSEQFLYDSGTAESVDGLITIDTTFLQNLLEIWDGIEVSEETDLITSKNLYLKICELIPKEDPNLPRPSSFLTNLLSSVTTKFLSSNFSDYKEMYPTFAQALKQKNMSITFKNSTANRYVNENGWDSHIDSKFLTTPVNIDWNWGINKANFYLKKTHSLDINIVNENSIEYTYKIGIQNDSTSNKYPEGEYTNYARIYLPSNAKVASVKGYTKNIYDLYEEDGYQIIGGWFNIPIQDTKTLEIEYKLEKDENPSKYVLQKSDTHYKMAIQIYKQPGSKKDSYTLSLNYPSDWKVENAEGLTILENSITRKLDLSSNQYFNISWQR